MTVWMPVGESFIEADVIRWKEPVFRRRRRQLARIGERLVIAEVLRAADGGEWVDLLVRGSEVVSANRGWNPRDVLLPAKNEETKRKRTTITRGGVERLAWSDESARAVVASRFLNERNSAPSMSAAPRQVRQPTRHSSSGTHKRRVRNPRWRPPRPRY